MTVAAVAALAVLLSGCATGDPTAAPTTAATSATPTSAAASPTTGGTPSVPATTGAPGTTVGTPQPVRVVLEKSGGIAGVQQTVTVEPDGRWTATDRSGAARTGRLSAADLERLRQLAADPRLAAEAADTAVPTNCADTFNYRLTIGGRTTGYVECPTDPDRPAATAAVVELLTRATA